MRRKAKASAVLENVLSKYVLRFQHVITCSRLSGGTFQDAEKLDRIPTPLSLPINQNNIPFKHELRSELRCEKGEVGSKTT